MSAGYLPSPAGFWKRYVAYFIDVVLVSVVVELLSGLFLSGLGLGQLPPLQSLLPVLMGQQALPEDPQVLLARVLDLAWTATVFSTVAYVLVGGAYFAGSESSAAQATLGKRLLGIKVTDAQGRRIGQGRALARFFAASLSWLTLNLGHALAAWTPERRALHDLLAGTRVENVDPAQPQMPTWGWVIVGAHALIFVLGIVAMVLLMLVALRLATAL